MQSCKSARASLDNEKRITDASAATSAAPTTFGEVFDDETERLIVEEG